MNRSPSVNILDSVFVASPRYDLVLFDRLPAEQRELLRDLRKDPDFYGVLRPTEGSGGGLKSVSRDTALLYLTLQQPGNLPEYVRTFLGDRCNEEMTKLVLDGILSVQWNDQFVSGSEAASLLHGEREELSRAQEVTGFLGRLSLEALRYGQGLNLSDAMTLSERLYAYNREPLSPYWKTTLRDEHDAEEFLGIRDSSCRDLLDRHWIRAPPSANNGGWLAWQSRRFAPGDSLGGRKIACKLYISPKTSHLPEAFPSMLAALGRSRAHHFKAGKDANGLLRPDKIVAYFASYEDLIESADLLKTALAGCPAQGVPFTAELTDDGLLSWGVDPEVAGQVLPWLGTESWRLWVTNRLAVALIAARSEDSAKMEPWQFALRRIQYEGVDTQSWSPTGKTGKQVS
jgi:hypothetical protein